MFYIIYYNNVLKMESHGTQLFSIYCKYFYKKRIMHIIYLLPKYQVNSS